MYTANYAVTKFTELPGCQHGGACGLAFGDGHAEVHRWNGPTMAARQQVVPNALIQQVTCPVTDIDMLWLAARTPKN